MLEKGPIQKHMISAPRLFRQSPIQHEKTRLAEAPAWPASLQGCPGWPDSETLMFAFSPQGDPHLKKTTSGMELHSDILLPQGDPHLGKKTANMFRCGAACFFPARELCGARVPEAPPRTGSKGALGEFSCRASAPRKRTKYCRCSCSTLEYTSAIVCKLSCLSTLKCKSAILCKLSGC